MTNSHQFFFSENTECSNKANENNKDVDISSDSDIELFLESFNYELEESVDPVPNCDLDNFIDDFDDEVQPSSIQEYFVSHVSRHESYIEFYVSMLYVKHVTCVLFVL
ncbi:hypothetical protein E2C01_062656 [Portunus trituberculatus]|uniref:Uncharacterized protein n=1 Tax=Portunus trituberculatus TaxID=210409 RepID=A0A5B7HIM9_PORTR|nr:hypothetical protein [Portunus trituberculatus]